MSSPLQGMSVESRYLTKLGEAKLKCPVCGYEGFVLEEFLYTLPYFKAIVLSIGRCPRCGYRFTDAKLVEAESPRKIVFKVEDPKDLNVLVVKAASAKLSIPELGLEMKPGPAAEGFITTVEGILRRFMDILEFLCNQPETDKRACEAKRKDIRDAIEGKKTFTLIIEDPEGVSTIVSDRARVEPLTQP